MINPFGITKGNIGASLPTYLVYRIFFRCWFLPIYSDGTVPTAKYIVCKLKRL